MLELGILLRWCLAADSIWGSIYDGWFTQKAPLSRGLQNANNIYLLCTACTIVATRPARHCQRQTNNCY